MIGINELEKRIDEILKFFKKRTKCIFCVLFDKDGFIISLKSEEYVNDGIKKRLMKLFIEIEKMAEKDMANYHDHILRISLGDVGDYFNNGIMLFLKSIEFDLLFAAVYPILLDVKDIKEEFNSVLFELSKYLGQAKNKNIIEKLYKLI